MTHYVPLLEFTQRTKEALRFKKEQGITLGRPKGPGKSKLDIFRPEIEGLLGKRRIKFTKTVNINCHCRKSPRDGNKRTAVSF